MKKILQYLIMLAFLFPVVVSLAQKQVDVLTVPGVNEFTAINEKGISVLPSGRYVTPAGETIRITHDPFGMAISPDGKKAVTLHNGVFTIIDLFLKKILFDHIIQMQILKIINLSLHMRYSSL